MSLEGYESLRSEARDLFVRAAEIEDAETRVETMRQLDRLERGEIDVNIRNLEFYKSRTEYMLRRLAEMKKELMPPVPPEKRPLREFPEQIRRLEETLYREAESQFRVLPSEEWLRNRATVREEIRSAIRAYEDFPKEEAEEKIRERVIKFVSELIESLRAPPVVAPPPPPAVVPMVAPPAVEIVYAPREKPITPEEMQAIKRELKVESMGDLLDKVLKGEVKPEEIKRVHEELMMKRRLEEKKE